MTAAMSALAWFLLIALSVLWGGSFFFVGVAVAEIPPLTLETLRVAIAAAMLWAALPLLGTAPPRGARAWGAIAVMGLINNVIPFTLIVWAQQTLPSGLAAILNATTPLWTVLVAHAFTREEKASPGKLAGVLFGFAGVAAMMGADILGGAAAAGAATTPEPSPRVPRRAPTPTVSPSLATIDSSTPALGEGTSTVTLSVSSSTRGSSAFTASPGFLNHFAMVASVTDSPSVGTLISIAMIVVSSSGSLS